MQAATMNATDKTPEFHEMMTLREFVDSRKGRYADNATLFTLLQFPKAVSELTAKLDEMGFRRFSSLGNGIHALAFHTTENQIVRISRITDEEGGERPNHPAILKAITRKKITIGDNDFLIEVLPKVRTEGPEFENALCPVDGKLRMVLNYSGYSARDLGVKGNVGLMDMVVDDEIITLPVLIDCGLLTHKVSNVPNPVLVQWLDREGNWLQDYYDPRKQPSGVITEAEHEWFKKLQNGRDSTMKKMMDAGAYSVHIRDAFLRAELRAEGGDISFADALKAEHAQMLSKPGRT
jgi:hypothetical protein